MSEEIKIAMIGIDTSHTVKFAKKMIGTGLKAVSCLSFPTAFKDKSGIRPRNKEMEDLGVFVTNDFDQAVADCDGIMIEINDPALHLEYFERCAELGKPVFLDKPLADNIANGKKIAKIAEEKQIKWFSCSSLRYDVALVDAVKKMPLVQACMVWGPLGSAPRGSSTVWYGVHAFEMLHKIMGRGAVVVQVIKSLNGQTAHVDYADGRRGLVDLTLGAYRYGGILRNHQDQEIFFSVAPGGGYYDGLMNQITNFFKNGSTDLEVADTLEIMGMLDAAERSIHSGHNETVYC